MNEEIVTGQAPAADATGSQAMTNLEGNPVTGSGTASAATAEGTVCTDDAGAAGSLTPGQMTLLTFLVGNPDVSAAAEAVGISRATVYRWMREPAFKEELNSQRNEIFLEALTSVKTHATQAVTQLAGMLNAPDDGLRRKVCTDMLDRAIKVHDMLDLERRLTALEKAVMPKKGASRQA